MYQVVEYNDYRKEVFITLHRVTSDVEEAKKQAHEINTYSAVVAVVKCDEF